MTPLTELFSYEIRGSHTPYKVTDDSVVNLFQQQAYSPKIKCLFTDISTFRKLFGKFLSLTRSKHTGDHNLCSESLKVEWAYTCRQIFPNFSQLEQPLLKQATLLVYPFDEMYKPAPYRTKRRALVLRQAHCWFMYKRARLIGVSCGGFTNLLSYYSVGQGQLLTLFLFLGSKHPIHTVVTTHYKQVYLGLHSCGSQRQLLRGVNSLKASTRFWNSPLYRGGPLNHNPANNNLTDSSVAPMQGFMHYQFHQLYSLERIFVFTPLRLNLFNVSKRAKNKYSASVSAQWGVSVSQLFSAARWLEREAVELFGVQLIGMLDQRNLLLQYCETSSPLKKVYPSSGWYEVYYIPVYNTLVERFLSQSE